MTLGVPFRKISSPGNIGAVAMCLNEILAGIFSSTILKIISSRMKIQLIMFGSSHLFVFWYLVHSYQKTKISTVLQCYLKKDQARFRIFRKFNKLESWYFGLLVASYLSTKHQKTKIWDEPNKSHFFSYPIFCYLIIFFSLCNF